MAYGDNLTTYTGEDAFLFFTPTGGTEESHSDIGIGDFTLTLDRGTVEQELVGQDGNYFVKGALSIDGSCTSVKLGIDGGGVFLDSLINNVLIKISGGTSTTNGVTFSFTSGQITGFDLSIGDASTITEASVDFTILNPYEIVKTVDDAGNTHLSC